MRLSSTAARLLIVFLACLVFVPPALFNPFAEDEACYAAIARHVVRTGDWLTFHYNGNPFWEKPPVALWGMSLSYQYFGVGEFTARIFAILSGIACLLVVYQFARVKHGVRFGLLAALLLLTCQDFVRFAARGQMDAPLTFLLTAGLLLFFQGLERPSLHLLAGLCFGVAVATKNQTGLWGWMIQVAYMLAARDFRPLKQWQWYAAVPLGLAVASPWFVQQYLAHGAAFVDSYYHYNFGLFKQTAEEQRTAGGVDYLFYVKYLIDNHILFLGPCVIASIGIMYRQRPLRRTAIGERPSRFNDPMGLFLAVWFAVVLVVCSFCGRKLFWYLMPMYPAGALLIAWGIVATPIWRRHSALVLVAVAVIGLGIQVSYYLPPPTWALFRSTRRIASAIQSAVPEDQMLFLVTDRAEGRPFPVEEPCEQLTHFHGDRVVRYVNTPESLQQRLLESGTIHVLACPSVLEDRYVPWFGSATFHPIARDGNLALYRVGLPPDQPLREALKNKPSAAEAF